MAQETAAIRISCAIERCELLRLPPLLDEMLQTGRWPSSPQEANQQNLKALAAPDNVRRLAPDETIIFLNPPPFHTVRELANTNDFWNWPESDPSGIVFDLAIAIGDFGIGSDSPILLDYRADADNPRVIRLNWSDTGKDNLWVHMADDFDTFVQTLGL